MLLLVMLMAGIGYSAAAGFVCAWIARERIWVHATALCVWNLGFGIFVQTQSWDLMPVWFHLTFLTTIVPATLVGTWLRGEARVPEPA